MLCDELNITLCLEHTRWCQAIISTQLIVITIVTIVIINFKQEVCCIPLIRLNGMVYFSAIEKQSKKN